MSVYSWKVGTDSRCIYLYGTRTFADETAEYVEPIKQYAAAYYSMEQIDKALANGWITQQEYDDTKAYKA